MGNKILDLFVSKGFLLNKEALDFLSSFDEGVVGEVVEILVSLGIKERVITRDLFDRYSDKLGVVLGLGDIGVSGVKVLSDLGSLSRKVGVGTFVEYFRVRYGQMREKLEKKEFGDLSAIRRVGDKSGVYNIIAMVSGKRMTKNGNLLLEVEDLTGKISMLVNKENVELFGLARGLMLDDVVAFGVSGSRKMLFVNEIVYPECVLGEERFGDVDEYIAFSGDFHVGSSMFLEKNFLRFVAWLNGEVGDERQRAISRKVKYLFLVGDNIDGVGVYPGQEKFLDIESCVGQYEKVESMLRRIRKDVQIVMCPGQHDAVWVGEPQGVIPKRWAPGLHEMENLCLVSNPALVEVGGFKILMYHGASINRFINEMPEVRTKFGHMCPTRVVREILKRGHLAPTYGVMDYVPNKEKDGLVIDVIPDIVATGDQHRAEVGSYNNILMVAGSCWQLVTPFEEKIGNVPEPCRVPLFNLKTREIKIVDFSDDGVRLGGGEGLGCKLEVKNEDSM
jgi:DNA polymerase II small subunit